jgi:hypothetical protein
MEHSSSMWTLADEDVYLLLYLSRVKGVHPAQLEKQFSLSRESMGKILVGQARKKCYANFIAVEKHLWEVNH